MAANKRRKAPLEELPAGLVESVERDVRGRGALPLRKLTKVKLTRHVDAELQEGLIRAGLERTGKHMRVPLDEQLAALLLQASPHPLTGLGRKLGGATQKEAKQTAFDMARAGAVRLVVVQGKDQIALPSDEQLVPDELKAAKARLDTMTKLLRKVAPRRGQPPKHMLRDELTAPLREACELLGMADTQPTHRANDSTAARDVMLAALGDLEQADPLVYVPQLVRSLADRLTPEQVLEALSRSSHEGVIELRPESGIRTLPPEDAGLCLPGPQGTVLSYVRRSARRGATP